MKYELENGKVVNIPDKEIEHLMKSLELTQADAIDLWLEDNDYQENAEQNELDEKAKKVKINHSASAIDKSEKKERKPREYKSSNEKQALFDNIYHSLVEIYGGKVEIVKENKLLTVVIGVGTGTGGYTVVILKTLAFFIFSFIVGYLMYLWFRWYDKRHPHSRRIPIFGIALAFLFAYAAERFFGIADITGAYVAGIVLCNNRDAGYIEEKVQINSYMLFAPVFFASIGLKTNITGITGEILLFSLAFVFVALITKIIGCSLTAKLCKFNWNDSIKVGVGMMTRGEVALIVAQKGLAVGLRTDVYFTAVIFLIIISSIATPIILKLLYSRDKEPEGMIECEN